MLKTLYSRLLLSHLAVIAVTVIVLGLMASWLLRNHVIETKRTDLLLRGQAAVALLSPALASGQVPDTRAWQSLTELTGSTLWLMRQDGKILAGQPPERWSRGISDLPEDLKQLFQGEPQTWVRMARKYTDRSVVVALPVQLGAEQAALFLYTPVTGINRAAQALETLLAYALLTGLITAALLSFMMSRSLTRPLANISIAAERFASGDFTSRTAIAGNHELGLLGHTFNNMADRIARIDHNRREFLDTVSHELKTPVASIQALSEALLDGLVANEAERRRYLHNIGNQARSIGSLITDLLDLSQLEQGSLSIKPTAIPVQAFFQEEHSKYEPLLASKNLTLQFEMPSMSVAVLADPNRLSQVLANLLSNAIRYAPEDSTITLTVAAARHRLRFSLTDVGPGISPKDLPHIWERFYRSDSARSRSDGGSGLGLAVTKKLVEAMGGEIEASSRPGLTTFTVILPVVTK